MGFIHFRTFVKKSCITLVIVAIAFVKILGGSGHVDKCDILLCCQLLHVIAVVHSMIISSYPLSCLVFTINQSVVFIAQVMTARTSDAASAEVTTTYGRNKNRCCAFLLHSIDKLFQTLLICCRGYSTASVALDGSSTGSIANTGIVGLKFQVVYTIILLVVVGKLDEHIVTSLNIVLGILPQLVVATTRITTTLGIVNTSPAIGEEIAKVHSPTTGIGGRLIIGSHRRITDGVYFLRCLDAAECQQRHNSKENTHTCLFHKKANI